jgi:hypothetical protein
MADKTESSSKVEGEFTGDGEDNAVKRKAPTTGLEGGAMKRKVEHCCSKGEEETVTVAGDKTMEPEDDSNYNKIHEECKARYEALMEKLFGGGAPHVRVTKYPSCICQMMVRLPMRTKSSAWWSLMGFLRHGGTQLRRRGRAMARLLCSSSRNPQV